MRVCCAKGVQDPQNHPGVNRGGAPPHHHRPLDLMVPESDARALAAYLHLLTRVLRNGPPQRVPAWVADWETQSLVTPLWELLFQLMCHPVPQARPETCVHLGFRKGARV